MIVPQRIACFLERFRKPVSETDTLTGTFLFVGFYSFSLLFLSGFTSVLSAEMLDIISLLGGTNMKKLIAMLLVLVLVVALGTTVFADGEKVGETVLKVAFN